MATLKRSFKVRPFLRTKHQRRDRPFVDIHAGSTVAGLKVQQFDRKLERSTPNKASMVPSAFAIITEMRRITISAMLDAIVHLQIFFTRTKRKYEPPSCHQLVAVDCEPTVPTPPSSSLATGGSGEVSTNLSRVAPVFNGVPQGAVLGVLFSLST